MNDKTLLEQFQEIEDNFNRAVVSNDPVAISACISDDWALVDAQGGIIPRQRFIDVVTSGMLKHDSMTKEILRIKQYGDVVVVTGKGQNTGYFMDKPIKAVEWITDVYVRINGKWICTLTHLCPVHEKGAQA